MHNPTKANDIQLCSVTYGSIYKNMLSRYFQRNHAGRSNWHVIATTAPLFLTILANILSTVHIPVLSGLTMKVPRWSSLLLVHFRLDFHICQKEKIAPEIAANLASVNGPSKSCWQQHLSLLLYAPKGVKLQHLCFIYVNLTAPFAWNKRL